MADPTSVLLYKNQDMTSSIIDIPISISFGQLLSNEPLERVLLSNPPRDEPYRSTEPKSVAARGRVMARMGPREGSYDYGDLIRKGLLEVRQKHATAWSLPRQLMPDMPARLSKKRKIYAVDPSDELMDLLQEPDIEASPMTTMLAGDHLNVQHFTHPGRLISIRNPASKPTTLEVSSSLATYNIPSRSAAILGAILPETIATFTARLAELYTEPSPSARPDEFDFILLDPPWSNSSVNRSKKYKIIRESNPIVPLSNVLGNHIAPGGLVACWITNKGSVRPEALTRFFDAWNVKLIEEWVWVKTTTKGEPLYDIDGLWRKPYEVLLVGRKFEIQSRSELVEDYKRKEFRRRLIFGVPDLHSRKPCLKELIEPMMPDPTKYRALEVFARNMTAGWLAWGDEPLKFNWTGHWSDI